jgi:uncharacterized protein
LTNSWDSNFATLLALVRSRSTSVGLRFHGEDHWREVGAIGLELADETRDCDRRVVLLFAVFHDAMRVGDAGDPDHGRRGAALGTEFPLTALGIEARQAELLRLACRGHTGGTLSADPTVGVCWDADRLTLGRVGIEPKARYFSTPAGRRRVGIAAAVPGGLPEWRELAERATAP